MSTLKLANILLCDLQTRRLQRFTKFPPWHGFSKATFLNTFGLLDFLIEKTGRPLDGSALDSWAIFRQAGKRFDPCIDH